MSSAIMVGKIEEIVHDDGSEFVNEIITEMASRWDIRIHSTGGYQPQANPVERYHRFLNTTMTMLCAKYGANWPAYLPAAVFAYNSSTCESTGYTPYELVFCAREATLLHNLDMDMAATLDILGLEEEPEEGTPTAAAFKQESYNLMHEMYVNVRRTQEAMAAKNRQLSREKNPRYVGRRIKYAVGDQVLFWEPQKQQIMQTEEQRHTGVHTTTRPAKWTDKWSGPHAITKILQKSTAGPDQYAFWHRDRAKEMTSHANKLTFFQPWSDGIASTSWQLDHRRLFRTGEWVKKNALVLVPLESPWPFGIAKMISSDERGKMHLQWLGNSGNNPIGTYEPGWMTKENAIYYATSPRKLTDLPYTAEMTGITMNQRDVLMHNFELTGAAKIPKPLLRSIADHPLVWWTPTTTK